MIRAAVFIATISAILAGCATHDSRLAADNATAPACPDDLTFSCVSYTGKKLHCACISREEMERILEPTKYP